MKKAYETLGLPTYHGFDWIQRPNDQVQWDKAIKAKFYGEGPMLTKKDFDELLGDFEVLSDFPFLGFWEEFVEWYPEAKVILVERDIDRWYASFDTGVISSVFTPIVWVLYYIIEPLRTAKPATSMWHFESAVFKCHDQPSFQKNAKPTYRQHYDMVRKAIPKERILDYKLGSGWEPLCQFLDEPIPNEKFPHLNEGVEFAKWMANVQRTHLYSGLLFIGRFLVGPALVLILALSWRKA